MFGSGISFGGLASGLDTSAIIEQLVALERIPIQQIEAQKVRETSKLDLIGTFRTLVQTLQDKARELGSASKFYSYTVGSSREGVATFGASGSAQAGSHTLEVVRTAAIDRWAFDDVADETADLATADGQGVSFTVAGVQYTATVTAADSSITEIAAAINEAAGEAVAASVVNTGTESAPSWQLVLASKKSGEENRITGITSSIPGLTIDSTGPDGNGVAQSANNVTVGANAVAVIDGLTVTRTDNDFGDVLAGVSIDLLSATAGEEITFTVEPDRAAIKGRIEALVSAYNGVIDFVNQQSEYSEESGTGGELFGDPILRRVRSVIHSALFDVDLGTVQGDTEGYSTLTLVGIEQDNDGRLSIDSALLDEKMSEDLELFADLFVDFDGFERVSDEPNTDEYFQDATADSGLAEGLVRALDRLLDTQQGPIIDEDTGERMVLDSLFGARQKALRSAVARYDDRIEAMERRLEVFEEHLVKRFAALEQLMGELNARGAALTSALLGISGKNA